MIVVAGRGTSDHAAIYARYLLEHALGVPVALAAASLLTQYGIESASPQSALLAFSQSGAGPDMIALVESAKRRGAYSIALTNDANSGLAAAADATAYLDAGPERAVAATKTYIAELISVALIAAAAARAVGRDAAWANEIEALSARMQASLDAASSWIASAADAPVFGALLHGNRALVVGRGFEYPNALELALKLRETTAMFADGYSAADLLHGPIASANAEVPTIVLSTDPATEKSISGSLERLRAVSAPTVCWYTVVPSGVAEWRRSKSSRCRRARVAPSVPPSQRSLAWRSLRRLPRAAASTPTPPRASPRSPRPSSPLAPREERGSARRAASGAGERNRWRQALPPLIDSARGGMPP